MCATREASASKAITIACVLHPPLLAELKSGASLLLQFLYIRYFHSYGNPGSLRFFLESGRKRWSSRSQRRGLVLSDNWSSVCVHPSVAKIIVQIVLTIKEHIESLIEREQADLRSDPSTLTTIIPLPIILEQCLVSKFASPALHRFREGFRQSEP